MAGFDHLIELLYGIAQPFLLVIFITFFGSEIAVRFSLSRRFLSTLPDADKWLIKFFSDDDRVKQAG